MKIEYAKFNEYLKSLDISPEETEFSITVAREYEAYEDNKGGSIAGYATEYIAGKEAAEAMLTALARYCRFTGRTEDLVYLISLFNTVGVIESMRARISIIAGEENAERVFKKLKFPPLGSNPYKYPKIIREFVLRLKKLPGAVAAKALTYNNHGIPSSAFSADKAKFIELGSIDGFLNYRREKTYMQMEECIRSGRPWHEQILTYETLDYIRSDPEMCVGKRTGNGIIVKKIPYDINRYLIESDPVKKRYYYCHCPFVRNSIIDGKPPISAIWCNCTAGFTKLIFDIIYGCETQAEVLESVLDGGKCCRFKIIIPE